MNHSSQYSAEDKNEWSTSSHLFVPSWFETEKALPCTQIVASDTRVLFGGPQTFFAGDSIHEQIKSLVYPERTVLLFIGVKCIQTFRWKTSIENILFNTPV